MREDYSTHPEVLAAAKEALAAIAWDGDAYHVAVHAAVAVGTKGTLVRPDSVDVAKEMVRSAATSWLAMTYAKGRRFDGEDMNAAGRRLISG